jgi:hypothetical protein
MSFIFDDLALPGVYRIITKCGIGSINGHTIDEFIVLKLISLKLNFQTK